MVAGIRSQRLDKLPPREQAASTHDQSRNIETGQMAGLFIVYRAHRRRANETRVPIIPITPKSVINMPMGGREAKPDSEPSLVNMGITNGGGIVNVGKRVAGMSNTNWAASVGSMVAVTSGAGVGGGATMGNESPPETVTKGE